MVGGLVEQQQVGLLPHDQRQREARLLAAGEAGRRRTLAMSPRKSKPPRKSRSSCSRASGSMLPQVPQRRVLQRAAARPGAARSSRCAAPARRAASPASGCSVPAIAFSSVDLPAPLGPSRPMRSPASRLHVDVRQHRRTRRRSRATRPRAARAGAATRPTGAKANSNGLSTCAAAMSSIRSSALMRLCACFALVALARKRSMNDCRCATWRCCLA